MRNPFIINAPAARYAAATTAALTGVGIAELLQSETGEATYTFPLAGIMLATLFGGLRAAALAWMIAAPLTALTLIDEPFTSLTEAGRPDVTRWVVFLAASVPVTAVGCATRWALVREAAARRHLEDARAHLALSLEVGRTGTWTTDVEGESLVCSPETREVLGVGTHDRLNSFDDLIEHVHPDDRDTVKDSLLHSFDWGAIQDVQVRLAADDAHGQRWVLIRGRVLAEDPGGAKSVVGILVDISAHKRQEIWNAFLARLGAEVVLPIDAKGRMEALATLLSSALGDACVVRLAPAGEPGLIAAAVNGETCAVSEILGTDDTARPSSILASLLRSRHPSPSSAAAPLVVRGISIGLVAVARHDATRAFGAEDLDLLRQAAARAAVAIENARLFERQRVIAETLQRSLLPPELPAIAGMELAAGYAAAGEGIEVGGDFYDAFESSKGCWVVAIGDVCGKGTEAASLTSLARHSMRVAALVDPHPGRILEALNTALQGHGAPPSAMMTAACVLIDRRPREMEVTLARAGHPPPLLVNAAQAEVTPIEPPGPVLGVFETISVDEVNVRLADDDALVLYTDGVTEARGREGLFGSSRLESLLADTVGLPAPLVVERIESAVRAYRSGTATDDTAILVLRRVPWAPLADDEAGR